MYSLLLTVYFTSAPSFGLLIYVVGLLMCSHTFLHKYFNYYNTSGSLSINCWLSSVSFQDFLVSLAARKILRKGFFLLGQHTEHGLLAAVYICIISTCHSHSSTCGK